MKDKCHDAITRIYPYLDGEITLYRRFRVRRHIRKCRDCGPAFSFEEQLKVVIRERCHEDPPPEFLDRLRAYLDGDRNS